MMTMLNYAALLFNSLALLIYQFFFADVVTISQNIPASAKAGTEIIVELTISKGTTTGFAKLQQDLPEGFIAVDKNENNGGSFTFTNQSVKLIWMSLPSDKEFKIKYAVKIPAGARGDKIIGGKFSYVAENIKQTVEITPATITIQNDTPDPLASLKEKPADATAPSTETAAATTPPSAEPVAANTSGNEGLSVTCTRKVPTNVMTNFLVEITVNKGNLSGFAKLLETLPIGFTAVSGESKGASFSFNDQKVKFVWVSLPSEPEFKLSYKINISAVAAGTLPIDGIFSYIENDETKKYTIPTSNVTIGSASPAIAVNNLTKETTEPEKKKEEPAKTPVTVDNTTTPVTTPVVADNTNVPTKPPVVEEPAKTETAKLSATTIPAPQGDVNYRVQIAALHRAVEASSLATRYNLNEAIITEMAQGFTKYTVGSHKEYKEAHDAREVVKSKGVVGPFVTAYNIGKRITVQEALMITSQKWFR